MQTSSPTIHQFLKSQHSPAQVQSITTPIAAFFLHRYYIATMTFRSQSLRIAKALSRAELQPATVQRQYQRMNGYCSNNFLSISQKTTLPSIDNLKYYRNLSTKPEEAAAAPDDTTAQSTEGGNGTATTKEEAAACDGTSSSTIQEEEEESSEDKITQLETQIKDLKDQVLRSLAEQENTRRIAKRDVSNSKSFAISSFAKSLLDTSDNLSRALDAVPEELRHDHDNHPVLANLYEGIVMTDEGLTKAYTKNGLVKFGVKGDKFDPNIHEALFEYPDPEGEAGNIGQVMKVGFMLNDRVVRPAEVGVVKAP